MNPWKRMGTLGALQTFQLLRYAALLAISIALSRSGIGMAEIGAYEAFLFLSSFVSYFWINGLIQTLLSLYPSEERGVKNSVFFNAFLLLLGSGAFASLALFLFGTAFFPETDQAGSFFLPFILLYTLLSGPSSLVEYIYLLLNQPKKLVLYGLAGAFLQLLLVIAPAFAQLGMDWILGGLLLSVFARIIWLFVLLQKHSLFRLSLPMIRNHGKTSMPLVFSSLVGGATHYYDSFLVHTFFDSATFAIFRYGARELPFVALMSNAFSNAWVPRLSAGPISMERLSEIKKKTVQLSHLLFPTTIILLLISPFLFPIVFNPSFGPSAWVFNLYLLIITSRLVFPQPLLIASKRNDSILKNTLIATLFHVLLGLLLIQSFGIEGMALAAVISNLLEKSLQALSVSRLLQIPLRQYLHRGWWFLYSLLSILAYLWVRFAGSTFLPTYETPLP